MAAQRTLGSELWRSRPQTTSLIKRLFIGMMDIDPSDATCSSGQALRLVQMKAIPA
jgi:hypothetical protein